jgi:cell division protein FtsL
MQDDLNANKTNVTCTSATVTSSNKVSESAADKLQMRKQWRKAKN